MPSGDNHGQRVTERAIKSLFGNGDQEHGGTAISLQVKAASPMPSTEALPFLGVPPLPIGEMRTKGVSELLFTVTFRRHTTANTVALSVSRWPQKH